MCSSDDLSKSLQFTSEILQAIAPAFGGFDKYMKAITVAIACIKAAERMFGSGNSEELNEDERNDLKRSSVLKDMRQRFKDVSDRHLDNVISTAYPVYYERREHERRVSSARHIGIDPQTA